MMSTMNDNVTTLRSMINMINDKLPENLLHQLQNVLNNHAHTDSQTHDNSPNIAATPVINNEYTKFINTNREYMSYMFNKREETFYKLTRCERLSTIYDQCLAESPPYVPKRLRHDNHHVLSLDEYYKLHESAIQRFKSENDILKMKLGTFTTKLNEIDSDVKLFVESFPGPQAATKTLIMKKWYENTDVEKERINKKWSKNISNLKVIHKRDKEYFLKSLNERFPNSIALSQRQTEPIPSTHPHTLQHIHEQPQRQQQLQLQQQQQQQQQQQ